MTAPERIWAWVYADPWGNELRWFEWEDFVPDEGEAEYIRHDTAALAASPVVQDMIRQAVEAEREACSRVCEEWGAWNDTAQHIAAAIRARGE